MIGRRRLADAKIDADGKRRAAGAQLRGGKPKLCRDTRVIRQVDQKNGLRPLSVWAV